VRLPPLPKERWGDGARAAVEAGFGSKVADRFLSDAPDAPPVPNVLGTLMHHPDLAGPWLAFNKVLLFAPSLAPRQRELMVLRVAARTGSAYEWAQHARMAPQCDITPEEVAHIEAGTGDWSPVDADLLAATDELLAYHRINDATWARLAAQFDERQLVELVFVVGAYTCLAMAFNSFGIELDADLQ
jgi:alkylhydroperoxidase family enzyme